MTARRPTAATTVAGHSVTVREGRVYLTDQEPQRDPGMTADQARALARALRDAAAKSEQRARAAARAERNRQAVEEDWARFNMELFDLLEQEGE